MAWWPPLMGNVIRHMNSAFSSREGVYRGVISFLVPGRGLREDSRECKKITKASHDGDICPDGLDRTAAKRGA